MTQTQSDISTRSAFPDELIALGQHMKSHPDLPPLFTVGGHSKYSSDHDCVVVHLHGHGCEALVAWARTLTVVESYADRFNEEGVNAHVLGRINGHLVDVYASVPHETFPEEHGRLPWDVTVQLQEA